MEKLFLYQLLKSDKLLFSIAVVFIAFQLFFTIKGVETFPFVHWGMYSEKKESGNAFMVFEIKVADKKVSFSDMIDCKKALIGHSLAKYAELSSNNFWEKESEVIEKRAETIGNKELLRNEILNDSASVKKYPYWLLQYFADMRLLQNPKIEITMLQLKYQPNLSLTVINRKKIGSYEYIQ
jgi:hypothetical protein